MDQAIKLRRFTATFRATDALPHNVGKAITFDVTPEIHALGCIIPKADPRGSDVLQFAEDAPPAVRDYRGEFLIEVAEV